MGDSDDILAPPSASASGCSPPRWSSSSPPPACRPRSTSSTSRSGTSRPSRSPSSSRSYAAALLLTLLTAGGLSDYLGRRRVLAGALVVELLSMVAFVAADGVGWLLVARAVQGVATGAAAGALSAGVADLTPPERPALAAAVNTAAPTTGIAVGALTSGALVQYAPAPRVLVFVTLIVLFSALLVALAVVPETVTRRPGSLRSLQPRASVPVAARSTFRAMAPVLDRDLGRRRAGALARTVPGCRRLRHHQPPGRRARRHGRRRIGRDGSGAHPQLGAALDDDARSLRARRRRRPGARLARHRMDGAVLRRARRHRLGLRHVVRRLVRGRRRASRPRSSAPSSSPRSTS